MRTLISMWPQLKDSARQMLCKAAEELVDGHTGVIELHCHKGGVRLLRVGREYRTGDGDVEYRLGEDKSDAVGP